MPYSSTAQLPGSVKKRLKSAKKRRQYMHVVNSMLQRGKGESAAFAAANSVTGRKKESMARELLFDATGKAAKITIYSGADDPDLPDHVKTMPSMIRSRWVNNYNWCVQDCQDDEEAVEMADEQTMVSVEDMMEMVGGMKEAPAEFPMAPVRAPSEPVTHGNLLSRFKAWLSSQGEDEKPQPQTNLAMFAVQKGDDGRMRVLITYSNNFRDRDGSILTKLAHKEFADAVEADEAPKPELHLWHGGPGTRWGQVETVSEVDGFAIAGGVVDPGKEHVALKLKELADQGEIAVSHGFVGLGGNDNSYLLYRTFEISPLPVNSESNPWFTGINFAVKESDMPFSAKKKDWLKANFKMTDDAIAQTEQKFTDMANALRGVGIDFKEADAEAPTPPTPAPPDPAPVPPPPAPEPPAAAQGDMVGLGVLAAAVKELAEKFDGVTKEVAALKSQLPQAVQTAAEDQIVARVAAAQGGGFRPTQAQSNVNAGLREAEANDPNAWFGKIMGNVLGAPVQPGEGAALAAVGGNSNGEVK